MSHIPNSAMPHASATTEHDRDDEGGSSISERAAKFGELVRANPKTAAAAGAAVVAGAVAAAAIPLVRSRMSKESAGKAGRSAKTN